VGNGFGIWPNRDGHNTSITGVSDQVNTSLRGA
jgi:hypothetical protein